MVTLSKLGTVMRCPGSRYLHWPRQDAGPAAAEGTRKHTMLEAKGKGELPGILDSWASKVDLAGLFDTVTDGCEVVRWHFEPAYAFDPHGFDCVHLGDGLARDYSKAPAGWICGTADVVIVCTDRVFVLDYKTGRTALDPFWTPQPSDNWQIKALAAVASDCAGVATAEGFIVAIDDTGQITLPPAVYIDSDERRAIRQDISATWSGREYHPSAHCRKCPASAHCPALDASVSKTEGETLPALIPGGDVTPGRVAELVDRMGAVEERVAQAWRWLATLCPEGETFDLGDGRKLEWASQSRRRVDSAAALRAVAEQHGDDAVLDVATVSLSALAKLDGGKDLVDALERLGIVTTYQTKPTLKVR